MEANKPPPERGRQGSSPFVATLENAAHQAPDNDALVSLSNAMSYAALLQRVRRAAHHVARAVPPGGAVATLLAHTPDGIAALLGCLASGRTTIVLNISDPAARTTAILADA